MTHGTWLTALQKLEQLKVEKAGDISATEDLCTAEYKLRHTAILNFEEGVAVEVQEAIDLLDGLTS